MSLGFLNYDIWSEVLASLECDFTSANRKEINGCRATIFHVALASKFLTDLALSVLWRSMDSLEPILHVINYFASGESGAFLYRQTYIRKSRWVLREPPKYDIITSRVRHYLRRIRNFHADGYSQKESALWLVLSRFLRCLRAPLLPNLQHLVINFSLSNDMLSDSLMLLLPPSLEHLEIFEDEGLVPSSERISVFYRILVFHRIKLKILTHHNAPPGLLSTLLHFKGLKSLQIEHGYKVTKPDKTTISDLFQQLPSLKTLCIDLGSVTVLTLPLITPIYPLHLSSLELHATTEEFVSFFCIRFQWPCLRKLHLEFYSAVGPFWEAIFTKIGTTFPTLETLEIDTTHTTDCLCLQIQDLKAVTLSSLTLPRLSIVPHHARTGSDCGRKDPV